MLEEAGAESDAEFGVGATRTRLYAGAERHADYVFVSPGVAVSDFRVLPDEVSDHAPLMLEFDTRALPPQLFFVSRPMMPRRRDDADSR